MLADLSRPQGSREADPGDALRGTLRPYQRDGIGWLWLLWRLGLGACLADDMGLGKTIQVLALLLVLAQKGERGPHLLVVPASLLGNWRAEMARFAPSLRPLVLHPSELGAAELASAEARLGGADVVLTTYGTVLRNPWIAERRWGVAVLDEAQAIKNPDAKQTRAVKRLQARMRLALTGTPVENRLSDLWSLFDFLCPGLLGSARQFRDTTKKLEASGPGGYAPLRSLVRPYILRRLKSDRTVAADLPDKTELRAFCSLTTAQAALYQRAVGELQEILDTVEGIQRRGVVLAFLMRFKQICNHPSQWLGDGAYDPAQSGKFARLRELCEPVAARQEKVLVFTQFREMTDPAGRLPRRGLRPRRPGAARRDPGEEARRPGRRVPARGRASVLRALAQGGRHRAQPHRGVARRPLRSLVEPGRGEPGHRSRLPHRAEEERARPQVRLPGHRRGEDRRAHRAEARPVGGDPRRRRRGLADRDVQRRPARAWSRWT